jgi:hypothetical protein
MATMDTECLFVEERVALFGRQAQQLEEQWERDHQAVEACWLVEDALRFGLSILDSLRRLSAQCADEARKRPAAEFSWDVPDRLAEVYRRFQKFTGTMLEAVRACEEMGYTVEGADQLREACREVSLMSLDIPGVRQSIGSLREGGGITLQKAMDELRNLAR